MLQFFSAQTNIVNSKRAITECLENALQGEKDLNCNLIIIYSQMGHNFTDLISEANKLSPGAHIVGCSCGGIIGSNGPDESIKSLAIMVIKGPENEFAVAGLDCSDYKGPFQYGVDIATKLKEMNPNVKMILFNPSFKRFIYDMHIVLEGIESVFGKEVPVVGGVSFDARMVSDFQFYDSKIFERSAVMVGFGDPSLELITQANHGLDVIGYPFEVTRSDGNRILEIEGRNPWEFILEKLGLPADTSPVVTIAISSLTTEIPITYQEEYGSKIKVVAGLIPDENGNIVTWVPFAKGSKLWLTRRNEQKQFEGVEWMMKRVVRHLDGRIPVAVFHADCQARGKHSFDRIMKDELINNLQYPICKGEKIPWLGMYGGGELTPLSGVNQLHVYTSSLYVLVHKK